MRLLTCSVVLASLSAGCAASRPQQPSARPAPPAATQQPAAEDTLTFTLDADAKDLGDAPALVAVVEAELRAALNACEVAEEWLVLHLTVDEAGKVVGLALGEGKRMPRLQSCLRGRLLGLTSRARPLASKSAVLDLKLHIESF